MGSPHQGYGTVTSNITTESVSCRGWATLAAHLDSGSGTWTWQFLGPDGVWRNIYGGGDGTTVQSFTASHMVNVYFGNDVPVRGVASNGSSVEWDWQIFSNVANRG